MLKVSSRLFPIGFIISVDNANFNPNDFYIDGNWERIKGRVVVGVDEAQIEFNTTGKVGGTKTHTLNVNEMPSHTHTLQSGAKTNAWEAPNFVNSYQYQSASPTVGYTVNYTGGGQPHNNLQPYQTAYVWKLISYSN